MAILSKGTDFSTGDQVTAAKLDALVDNATFASDAVDGSTTALDTNGKIIVKDGGITPAKLNLAGGTVTTGAFRAAQGVPNSADSSTTGFAFSTDGDTGMFCTGTSGAAAGGDIAIFSNDEQRLTISSSGQIKSFGSTFANLQLIAGDNTLFSSIDFGDAQDENIQRIVGDHSDNSLEFFTSDTERMRITSAGNVGIGTTSPTKLLSVVSPNTTTAEAVAGFGNQSIDRGLEIITNGGTSSLEWGFNAVNSRSLVFNTNQTERMKINSSGTVSIVGALSKGSGSFKIDHPIPEKKDTHHLVHSFVESPQADNIYRGKVNLVGGTATINIDTEAGMTEGTFALLNRDIQCFSSNESGWTAVKASVSGNLLTITAQDDSCSDTISWLVIGERQDQHMYDTDWTDEEGKVIVEPLKES